MGTIIGNSVIAGGIAMPLPMSGQPSSGATGFYILTFGGTPTGGTFTITFDGYTTDAITWSSTNSTLVSNIDAALEALPSVGTSGVTTAALNMSSGIGTISLTLAGNLLSKAYTAPTVSSSLTGTSPTLAVTEAIAGVNASFRGCAAGAVVVDTATGNRYVNISTSLTPTWVDCGNLTYAGAPGGGTSSVNTIDVKTSTSGGSATLTYGGLTTPAFAFSSTNSTFLANVQLALDNTFGTNAFVATAGTLTSGIGTMLITASNRLAKLAIGAMTITSGFTGGAAATISETTAGVTAAFWGCGKGTVVKDVTNGKVYVNTGTNLGAPTWTVVGTQS